MFPGQLFVEGGVDPSLKLHLVDIVEEHFGPDVLDLGESNLLVFLIEYDFFFHHFVEEVIDEDAADDDG